MEMINTRVIVKGTLKNGITSEFSGNLDLVDGTMVIVDRLPVYNVTSIEPNPSGFKRKWNVS